VFCADCSAHADDEISTSRFLGSRIDVHWERPLQRGQGRGRIRSYRIEVEVDSITETAYEQAHYASFVRRAQSIRMAREWGARAATAAASGHAALVASCLAGQVNAAAPAGAPVAANWVAMELELELECNF
jgi:hypothetical protein